MVILLAQEGIHTLPQYFTVIYSHFIKAQDPTFHAGRHGGARESRFKHTVAQRVAVKVLLFSHAKAHPLARLGEYKRVCQKHGFKMSLSEISKLFKSWRWSFKKPHHSMLPFLFFSLGSLSHKECRAVQQIQKNQFNPLCEFQVYNTVNPMGKAQVL